MEEKANEVFTRYAQMYFDTGFFTSVYFFDTDHDGFGACFLIKKEIKEGTTQEGMWDSIHSVTVSLEQKKAKYRVVSTVIIQMKSTRPDSFGELNIAGSLSKTSEEQHQTDAKSGAEFHISNIGSMIEANETQIRSEMDGIYIGKTKQIINTGRLREEYMTKEEKLNFQEELASKMGQIKSQSHVIR